MTPGGASGRRRVRSCSQPGRAPNTGEKLTPRSVSTLVEPFERGTERVRTHQAGVGLGLAIVKSITRAHDGTLTLTPRAAGGLRATVELPAAEFGFARRLAGTSS